MLIVFLLVKDGYTDQGAVFLFLGSPLMKQN